MSLQSIDTLCEILYAHFPSELLSFGCIGKDTTTVFGISCGVALKNNLFVNITEITLPLCRYVGHAAFICCSNLRVIHCPEVVYIHSRSFMYCSSLKVVDMPKLLTIETRAFEHSALEQVVLPACRTLGDYVFDNCRMLRQVVLPRCINMGYFSFPNYRKDVSNRVQVNAPLCFKG